MGIGPSGSADVRNSADTTLPDSELDLSRSHAPSNNTHAVVRVTVVHRRTELVVRTARTAWASCFRTRSVVARSMPRLAGPHGSANRRRLPDAADFRMASPRSEVQGTPASPWRPLHTPVFRNLLLADVVSDVGTFMQTVGAAWLMISLRAGPMYVALTQTASALAFFVFAIPAGAIGDIVDRRKLILYTETWMASVAIVITAVTFGGAMTPWLLLSLTFALSAGDAIESPTWRAVLPELVGKDDLAAASALNGIEFNFARAVGPALAGVVIAVAGVGTAFAINVLSFAGVIAVVARWKRPATRRTTPPETVAGAVVAAVRYVRYSPALRRVMVRAGVTMFFASALLALLPSVAHGVSAGPTGYGVLLGCFGGGAVLGAVVMPSARSRWSTEIVASGGVAILGLATIAVALVHVMGILAALLLVAGAAWIVFISLVNALVQLLAPDWVRARVLAVFLLVFQGSLAAGSAFWGTVAAHRGILFALVGAGLGTVSSVALALVVRLPDTTVDASPWNHWRMPVPPVGGEPALNDGPVLVTAEYTVAEAQAAEFLEAIREYARIRRRDGAYRWSVFRDVEKADLYIETFLVSSWAEHLRQHDRSTAADRTIESRVFRYVTGPSVVRHFIAAETVTHA
jgi:MFS family permease